MRLQYAKLYKVTNMQLCKIQKSTTCGQNPLTKISAYDMINLFGGLTADLFVCIKPPSDEGGGFCEAKDGERRRCIFAPPLIILCAFLSESKLLPDLLYRIVYECGRALCQNSRDCAPASLPPVQGGCHAYELQTVL